MDIDAEIQIAVENGDMEIAGMDEFGMPLFRLTRQGKEKAEAVFRRVGIDPAALDEDTMALALYRLDAEEQAHTS
jgi:hypothetical protein